MTRKFTIIILTSLGLGFLCWRTLRAAQKERDALNAHLARMQTMRVPAARVLPDRDGIVYATGVNEYRPWVKPTVGPDDYKLKVRDLTHEVDVGYAERRATWELNQQANRILEDLHATAPGVEDAYQGFTFAHDAEPPFTFNRTQFDKDLTELRDKGTPPPSSPAAFRHYFEGRQ